MNTHIFSLTYIYLDLFLSICKRLSPSLELYKTFYDSVKEQAESEKNRNYNFDVHARLSTQLCMRTSVHVCTIMPSAITNICIKKIPRKDTI